MAKPTKIGVIGCGLISHAYLGTIARDDSLTLRALASHGGRTAADQAARYGGVAMTVDAMLADDAVDIVVNLAPPALHYELGMRAIAAGKHLYSEKPFATTMAEARALIAHADAAGRLIGCAPDTFLAPGHQAARRLVDAGAIGRVTGGVVAFGTHGVEGWHPNPHFFYAQGGGPLLDIGPYYVTQLVNLLGPVVAVTAMGTIARVERVASAPGRAGERIAVDVPTTVNGALLFANGANVSIAMSWDVAAHRRPPIELYGEDGALSLGDPNHFGRGVQLFRRGEGWVQEGPVDAPPSAMDDATIARAVVAMGQGIDPFTGGPIGPDTGARMANLRGMGLIDMADAIASGRAPRASGALAAHVLDVLLALEASARDGGRITIASSIERPEAMP